MKTNFILLIWICLELLKNNFDSLYNQVLVLNYTLICYLLMTCTHCMLEPIMTVLVHTRISSIITEAV